MDFHKIELGRWFGIPVSAHWSWAVVLAVFLILVPEVAPVWLTISFIVVLHELGHCLMAQRLGHKVIDIKISAIGGVARIDSLSSNANEFLITIAGPAVNVALIPVIFGMEWIYESLASEPSIFLGRVFYCNAFMAVFNLIPAFPMDGGRILRATLFYFWKDNVKATTVAARIAQFLAVGMILFGATHWMVSLAIIGIFVLIGSESELQSVKFEAENGEDGSGMSDSERRLLDIERRINALNRET